MLGPWDHARKTFFCRRTPDIFAFCGDALFPAMVLPQVVDVLDARFAASTGDHFAARFNALHGLVSLAFRSYPMTGSEVTIVHAGRDGIGMASEFRVGILSWLSKTKRWQRKLIDIPQRGSGLILQHGSGARAIQRAVLDWRSSAAATTSRVAFMSFVQALKSGLDPASGGPPQMVGLYRIGNGRRFGIVWKGKGYLAGLPVGHPDSDTDDLEWRNEAFERVSVVTRLRLPGAQRHAEFPAGRGRGD